MTIKRITAIVPINVLEPLRKNLRACGAMAGILAVESIDRLVSLTDGPEIVPGPS